MKNNWGSGDYMVAKFMYNPETGNSKFAKDQVPNIERLTADIPVVPMGIPIRKKNSNFLYEF